MAETKRTWGRALAPGKNRTNSKQKARGAKPRAKPGRGRPASKKRAATHKVETTAESQEQPEDGEQLFLIDVESKEAKEIAKIARAYRRAVKERQAKLAEEVKFKERLLKCIKESDATPDKDGIFKIRVGDLVVIVKPRDELVKVKFDNDEEADG